METREELYKHIQTYPLPDHIITYRPHVKNQPHRRTTFEDVIHLNLHELIPNVYLGLHQNYSGEEIENWAEMCKSYGNKLNDEFQYQCNQRIQQIQQIEQQKIRSSKFSTENIKYLPEDIQQEIQSYLMPETRLLLLQDKYSNIKKDMKKWKVEHLKKFLKDVICNIYEPKCYENYMKKCLPRSVIIYKTCTNKNQYIEEIFKLFDLFKTAVPKNYNQYQFYWKTALRLFMSILYVHKTVVKPEKIENSESVKITNNEQKCSKKKYRVVKNEEKNEE